MLQKMFRPQFIGNLGAAVLSLAAAFLMIPAMVNAQEATPSVPGSLEQIGTQSKDLTGKKLIWQIDKVTAVADDANAEEFEAEFGFIVAYQMPITVTVGNQDPVDLAVGEAIPVQNGDHVKAMSTDETLGSFYTIELIDILEIDNELNRQVIGTPFDTTGDNYTMTLSSGTLEPGVAVPLDTVDLPAMVLVLQGELIRVREDQPSASIGTGYASAGFGEGTMAAGPDGATFLLAQVMLTDAATPVVE